MQPLVYIIIVHYCNPSDTAGCIKSLEAVDYNAYRIVIVDNNPGSGLFEELLEVCAKHIIIRASQNNGYAAGLNLGIAQARKDGAEYILILNNDVTVVRGILSNLTSTFQRFPNAGAVGPKIYYKDSRRLWFAGGHIDLFRFVTTHRGTDQMDQGQYDREEPVGFLIGCCFMVKASAIEKIGLLDQSFFLFYEDTDFCLRLRKAGYDLIYNPSAVVHHKVAGSMGHDKSPFAIEWWTRSRKRFMKKHGKCAALHAYWMSFLYFYASRLIFIAIYLLTCRFRLAKAVINGILK